jgi:hypothetical protein
MWKFLGKAPPSVPSDAKIKQTPEVRRCKAKEYEKDKRERVFLGKWLTEFDFLLTGNGQKMYCKPCRSSYGPLAPKTLPHTYDRYRNGPFVVKH